MLLVKISGSQPEMSLGDGFSIGCLVKVLGLLDPGYNGGGQEDMKNNSFFETVKTGAGEKTENNNHHPQPNPKGLISLNALHEAVFTYQSLPSTQVCVRDLIILIFEFNWLKFLEENLNLICVERFQIFKDIFFKFLAKLRFSEKFRGKLRFWECRV